MTKTPPIDPGPCMACGADEKRKRTEFIAATNGRVIKLCRDCTKLTLRVQRNLEASRAYVYGRKG